jgi:hypothetical protein
VVDDAEALGRVREVHAGHAEQQLVAVVLAVAQVPAQVGHGVRPDVQRQLAAVDDHAGHRGAEARVLLLQRVDGLVVPAAVRPGRRRVGRRRRTRPPKPLVSPPKAAPNMSDGAAVLGAGRRDGAALDRCRGSGRSR